jgi:DNA-binding NarL/FixJ family response regulator
LLRLLLAAREPPSEVLSDRELEVFQFLGEGLATRQIADKLKLSPKTVERYRENIKDKLNLASAAELVHRATEWVLKQE